MTEIKMLTADEKMAEIRRLYFRTTRHTISRISTVRSVCSSR